MLLFQALKMEGLKEGAAFGKMLLQIMMRPVHHVQRKQSTGVLTKWKLPSIATEPDMKGAKEKLLLSASRLLLYPHASSCQSAC